MIELKFPEMDMPKCCGRCFFNRQTRNGWKCCIAYLYRWRDFGNPLEKPDWCPLPQMEKQANKNSIPTTWIYAYVDSLPENSREKIAIMNMFVKWRKDKEQKLSAEQI